PKQLIRGLESPAALQPFPQGAVRGRLVAGAQARAPQIQPLAGASQTFRHQVVEQLLCPTIVTRRDAHNGQIVEDRRSGGLRLPGALERRPRRGEVASLEVDARDLDARRGRHLIRAFEVTRLLPGLETPRSESVAVVL